MVKQKVIDDAATEVAELANLLAKIKADTDEFISRSQALSQTGAHEAQKIMAAVKGHWESFMRGFSGSGQAKAKIVSRKSAKIMPTTPAMKVAAKKAKKSAAPRRKPKAAGVANP